MKPKSSSAKKPAEQVVKDIRRVNGGDKMCRMAA